VQIFGLSITRTKTIPPSLSNVPSRGGWWPLIAESFAGAWQSNVEVELANVLTYSPVFACVRLISSDIGKCDFRLVQQDANGLWTETERSAFSPVLRRPNRYQTTQKFIQQWLISKLIHGNTYVLLQRDNRGAVVAMYVLDPTRVRPLVAPDGSVYYSLNPDNLTGLIQDVIVPASEIIHDIYLALYHPLVGISPISACGIAAVEALRIQESSTVFFGNGSKPGGVLTAPGHIAQETADRVKAAWDTNFTGENAGKVAVLGDGLKYEQMAVNANDAQLIEQLKWTAEDVCQAFGVPPYKINVGPMPTYNNIEALDRQYYGQCIQELMKGVEDSADIGLGLAPGKIDGVRLGTEFNRHDLLQMDTAGRVEAAVKTIFGGALSPNEARLRYLDAPPVKGGDSPMLQQQQFSLEALAERDQSKPFSKPTPAAQADAPGGQQPSDPSNVDQAAMKWMDTQTPAPPGTPQPDTTRALDPAFQTHLAVGYFEQAVRKAYERLPA
jgi:HK97 family phage portal protein